jgi:hypothetical protein
MDWIEECVAEIAGIVRVFTHVDGKPVPVVLLEEIRGGLETIPAAVIARSAQGDCTVE